MKTLKRLVLTLGLVSALMFALNPAPASAQEIRIALEEITGSPMDTYAQDFKKRVLEKLPQWDIQIYPIGVLGDAGDIAEQTMSGVVQFDLTCSNIAPFIPMIRIFSIPFLWSRDDGVNAEVMYNSPALYEILGQACEEKNLKLLSIFPEGWQIWLADKPLRKPDDFKDFRFRVMADPLLAATYKSYGANPQHLPFAEVYSGLQLKQIDGNVQPYAIHEEMGYYELHSQFTNPHDLPFISAFVANLDWYDSCTDEERQIMDQAAKESIIYATKAIEEMNLARVEKMKSKKDGLVFYDLNDEEREAFRKLSQEPVEKEFIGMAGPEGERLLKALKAEIKAAEEKAAIK
jgi:TRAP-type C4-dicarboxylate transport system substrate-binding protein